MIMRNFCLAFVSVFILGSVNLLHAQSLIISEYCEYNHNASEPPTFNHYIELYNPSNKTVDMTHYQLWRARDGGGWNINNGDAVKPLDLTGTLAPKATYVITRPHSDEKPVTVKGQISWNFLNISGNDAIGLAKKNDSGEFLLIDVIGTPDKAPKTAWAVAGIAKATKDHTLLRKPSACEPTTDWTKSAGTDAENSQWIVKDENDISNVSQHNADCGK